MTPRTTAASAAIRHIDRVNELVGRATSWLVLAMVLNTFAVALLRYGFGIGWIWLQETYVWMHGAIIMLAAGYTLLHDGHVRVDIFYRGASPRFKAWVDLVGFIVLLVPTIVAVWWVAWPYVLLSWERLEQSREAGGLPGLYLWKTTMLVFCVLLLLQGLALAARSALILLNKAGPDGNADPGRGGVSP